MTGVAVRLDGDRAGLTLRDGAFSPRVLSVGSGWARVAMVGLTAMLLGGDRVEIDIEVGPGAGLELVEVAGVVAYDAAGQESTWQVRIRVAEGGRLRWAGQPFVIAGGANVVRSLDVDLDPGAVLLQRDTVVLGRHGETGGALRVRTRASVSGIPLLVEDLDLSDVSGRELPGVLGRGGGEVRVLDQVCWLGSPAPDQPAQPPGQRLDLHGPGCVARWLGRETAESPISPVWRGWADRLS